MQPWSTADASAADDLRYLTPMLAFIISGQARWHHYLFHPTYGSRIRK